MIERLSAYLRELLRIEQHVDLKVTIHISGAEDPAKVARAVEWQIRESLLKAHPKKN